MLLAAPFSATVRTGLTRFGGKKISHPKDNTLFEGMSRGLFFLTPQRSEEPREACFECAKTRGGGCFSVMANRSDEI